jgi:hypothetical protein
MREIKTIEKIMRKGKGLEHHKEAFYHAEVFIIRRTIKMCVEKGKETILK